MKTTTYRFLVILAFIAIYFIWGTTYLAIRIGLEGFPPYLMASIRFFIAGILMVGYSLFQNKGFPHRRSIVKNIFIGLVVLAGGQGLLIWSEQYIASGYASVLVATLPIWFVSLDRANWKYYFNNPFIISGVLLGFAGIVLLFREKLMEPVSDELLHLQIVASLAVLFGAMCWVVGTLYNRSRPAPGSIHLNLGWQLLAGGVICGLISLALGETHEFHPTQVQTGPWMAVFYLSIAGSILAFFAYTWLLTQFPAAIVGTYAYVNPIVAVFLGWWLAAEVISSTQLVGMSIVLVSAIMINISRSHATKPFQK